VLAASTVECRAELREGREVFGAASGGLAADDVLKRSDRDSQPSPSGCSYACRCRQCIGEALQVGFVCCRGDVDVARDDVDAREHGGVPPITTHRVALTVIAALVVLLVLAACGHGGGGY
jgi:hypothetical protein